jgi:ribosomal-protein-serine acetyltransferase
MLGNYRKKVEGKRIVLKKIEPTIENAQKTCALVEESRALFEKWLPWVDGTLTPEGFLKFLFDYEKSYKGGEKLGYGIYLKNKLVGRIDIINIDKESKSGEIDYWLSAKFVGKGYMSEALRMLEQEAFKRMGFNRIQIQTDTKNKASIRVAEKCDYKLEGVLRENSFSKYFKNLRDTNVFSKLKSEFKSNDL